jgi:outer membrane protein assembly factor BamE (lipoprotein component of BamABCDE complex)
MFLRFSIFPLIVVISILVIYYWKGARWGWRNSDSDKLALRTSIICALLFFTVVGLALVENRETKQSKYHDLALGMTKAQVVYIKGPPTSVAAGDLKDALETLVKVENIDAGLEIEDFNYWNYRGDKEQSLDVEFDKAGNGVVGIGCYSPLKRSCPSIRGISTGNVEEDVLRRLGEPDTEEITNGIKTISYKDLNIVIKLKQKNVYFVGIRSNSNRQ